MVSRRDFLISAGLLSFAGLSSKLFADSPSAALPVIEEEKVYTRIIETDFKFHPFEDGSSRYHYVCNRIQEYIKADYKKDASEGIRKAFFLSKHVRPFFVEAVDRFQLVKEKDANGEVRGYTFLTPPSPTFRVTALYTREGGYLDRKEREVIESVCDVSEHDRKVLPFPIRESEATELVKRVFLRWHEMSYKNAKSPADWTVEQIRKMRG
jgi:hypothetical protein